MIKPHPESDLSLNIMVLGSQIIKWMKEKSTDFLLVENVLEIFLKNDKKRSPDLFIHSLIFLYSLGIIEYQGYKIRLNIQVETQQELF